MYKTRKQYFSVDMSIQAVTQRLRMACGVAPQPRPQVDQVDQVDHQVAMDPMSVASRLRLAGVPRDGHLRSPNV